MENITYLEIENNYTITFNNTEYPVNKELLCYYSSKLKKSIEESNNQTLDLSDPTILDSSFASFVNACQNRPYSINPSNFYDFRDLSIEYDVKNIQIECNEFQNFCPIPDLLVHHLFYRIRKNSNTQKNIMLISRNFPELAQRKELLSAPQEYLKEIIELSLKEDNRYKPDQSIIFKFLTMKYEQDESIIPLFQILDPNKFTVYELKWILDHPQINTDFISSCYDINQKIKTINDQIKERQEKIDNYAQILSQLGNKHHYHDISNKVQKLKEKYINTISETDDESAENLEYADIFQEIQAKIEAIFGNDSGISELEEQINDNIKKLKGAETDAEDLRYSLGMTLEKLENPK